MGAEITAPIRCIAFAPQDTAPPTLAAAGSNMTYDGDWTQETEYLDEDQIVIKPRQSTVEIDPPTSQNRLAEFIIKNGLDTITFSYYELSTTAMGRSNTATISGGSNHLVTEGTTITYKAMIVEFTGIGIVYCPKVRTQITEISGAVNKKSGIKCEVKVFGTTNYPAGYQWQGYV